MWQRKLHSFCFDHLSVGHTITIGEIFLVSGKGIKNVDQADKTVARFVLNNKNKLLRDKQRKVHIGWMSNLKIFRVFLDSQFLPELIRVERQNCYKVAHSWHWNDWTIPTS